MWKIEFTKSAAGELLKFPKNIQLSIKRAVCERLAVDPYRFKPLRGEWKNCFRLRVGSYRIVYEIKEKEVVVIIIKIDVRGSVYR